MKKGVLTFGLAGILALVLPKAVYSQANVKNEVRRENITARKPVLENIITGQVTNSLTEQPIGNVNLKFYEYLGNGQVGDLICEYLTGNDGYYNKANAVELVYWGAVKALFRDNPSRNFKLQNNLAKTSSSDWAKVEIKGPNHYEAVRYVNLAENDRFDFNIIPVHDVEVCDIYWDQEQGKNVSVRDNMDFMEFFDIWYRSISCIQGWGEEGELAGKGPENAYINTNPAYGSGNEVTQDNINLVYEIIDYLGEYGFINEPYIEEGTNPPERGTEDWSKIYWRDDGGPGYHGELVDGNKIYYGIVHFWTEEPNKVWTKDDKRRAYLEEITQNFTGARTEAETAYFWDENGYYLPVASEIAKVLKSIKIGSKSPDIDPEPF